MSDRHIEKETHKHTKTDISTHKRYCFYITLLIAPCVVVSVSMSVCIFAYSMEKCNMKTHTHAHVTHVTKPIQTDFVMCCIMKELHQPSKGEQRWSFLFFISDDTELNQRSSCKQQFKIPYTDFPVCHLVNIHEHEQVLLDIFYRFFLEFLIL